MSRLGQECQKNKTEWRGQSSVLSMLRLHTSQGAPPNCFLPKKYFVPPSSISPAPIQPEGVSFISSQTRNNCVLNPVFVWRHIRLIQWHRFTLKASSPRLNLRHAVTQVEPTTSPEKNHPTYSEHSTHDFNFYEINRQRWYSRVTCALNVNEHRIG